MTLIQKPINTANPHRNSWQQQGFLQYRLLHPHIAIK